MNDIEILNPDLGWKFMQFIPYRLWKFINLFQWILWYPLRSHIEKDFSWCPFDCQTGYDVWRIIHEG